MVAAAFLLLLPLAFFFRPLFLGRAFLPADLLRYLSPWKASQAFSAESAEPHAAWNVLRFDGISEFYPWRLEAARSYRAGRIPLWNPHQFAARGGIPLLANSQSAPLYLPNAIFWLTPLTRFWYAFGLSAALHMFFAAVGLYRLLRVIALARLPSLLGATTFVLSAPVVAWLSLPTFLAVVSWLPWLLLLMHRAHGRAGTPEGRLATAGAGGVMGMMLLAGHLQMAFYCLLGGAIYLLWQGHRYVWRQPRAQRVTRTAYWAAGAVGAVLLGISMALPQVLPALALSRVSHRAGGPPPSIASYGIYTANAMPWRQMATLLSPEFFGDPNAGTHWENSDRPGGNNYAEWALYVGVAPLLLAAFALLLPWKQTLRDPAGRPVVPAERGFFALLAGFMLLLATGSPVNAPFFFLLPGYSQLSNPARCLSVFALAIAALAAIGLDQALRVRAVEMAIDNTISSLLRRRACWLALTVPLLLAAVGMSQATNYARDAVPETAFGNLLQAALPDVCRGLILLGLAFAVLLLVLGGSATGKRRILVGAALLGLTFLDLFSWGAGYNPLASPEQVYPVTPGIAFLQDKGKDARIAVLNKSWTLGATAPRSATLPPNSATVYGLHDIGGYDSLFPGDAKRQVAAAGEGEDPSPLANGNIVFIKRIETAINLGAHYIAVSPALPALPDGVYGVQVVYDGPDLRIYENAGGQLAAPPPSLPFDPFRIGLYCALCSTATLAGIVCAITLRRQSQRTGPH